MAGSRTLVLDAGTTGPRCYVFGEEAKLEASARRTWTYRFDEEGGTLAREFDPSALWRGLCRLVRSAMAAAGVRASDVGCVAVTGQRQAVAFLDAQGREVYAGPNVDLRAVFEGAALDDEHGEAVYRTTGHTPSFFFAPAKLRWFRDRRRDAYDRIAAALPLADWAVWRLTGEMGSEASGASEAGLLDIAARRWCRGLLADLGLGIRQEVPLAEAATVVGRVGAGAARETGLAPGTAVVSAGADTQCGMLGLGCASEGSVGVLAGWSAPVQMVTAAPVLSPERRTWAGCFLAAERWVLESNAGDAGNSYRWLGDALFGDGAKAFAEMDRLASSAAPGSEGVTAFFGETPMDASRLGMRTGGLLFPTPVGFGEAGRGHLVRAAIEATAYAIRANLEQVEDVAGRRAADVALGGGMARTEAFVSALADVLGRRTWVARAGTATAVGAFWCAAAATGAVASLDDAARRARGALATVEPDPQRSAEYDERYRRWLDLGRRVRSLEL